MQGEQRELLYALNDRPPLATTLLAGMQHLLAVFGGIVTAPLIIAVGMGLSAEDTRYLLSSALFVSGVATAIQITRIGPVGSGLLSVQGTSFTFIGPILFAFAGLSADYSAQEKLAIILGSCGVAACAMIVLSFQIVRLQRIFTPIVTGATVILLGMSLVWTTLSNLYGMWREAAGSPGAWQVPVFAVVVLGITLLLASRDNPWMRLCCIIGGLGAGALLAAIFGALNFSALNDLPGLFLPQPMHFGIGFDWGVFLLLMPVFIVSATESVGDLTATSSLSGLSTRGRDYWLRVRGGILGDSINSLLSAVLATFPNTTFSQNNGVIRLTGIASRRVGYALAALLVLAGSVPVVAGVFQVVPAPVVFGATLLMFTLVLFAGIDILRSSRPDRRGWAIAVAAVLGGWGFSSLAQNWDIVPPQLAMLLQFPVSTGAFFAMFLEIVIPRSRVVDVAAAG